MKRQYFNDHEFAQYLNKVGGVWSYQAIDKRDNAALTECYGADGTLIALVIYDNAACEHWIYTPN